MAYLSLTSANLKSLKTQIRDAYQIPSAHLSEALAASLGFRNHAALTAHLKQSPESSAQRQLSDDAFLERLDELGTPIAEWRGFASFQCAAVTAEGSGRVVFGKQGPFRIVYNLWLAPNFERVLAGKANPPFVDHDKVDFAYLRSVLADEFRFGSPVEIRIANDTIDQVTAQFRQKHPSEDLIRCRDFAGLLLNAAKDSSGSIIDIRRQWLPLHMLKERRHAPPPVLIPIVVEAIDAEDAILWSQQAQMRLGVKAANPEYLWNPPRHRGKDDQQGYLTERLHKAFKKCFNTPYLPYCVMDRAASDPLPNDYR
ncbi:hypothetical protein [Pseudomonas aeruginosa]|uniref:hypothetical protein n=1 Tax=Pseudomonas aeruginosa TaxID=287 RepID=UPI0034E06C7D